MRSIFISFSMTLLLSLFSLMAYANERPGNLAKGINPGTLEVLQIGGEKPNKKLEMPLQHTDVKIEVSGFVASATVTQHYHNPFKKPIEAVYTFPLPNDAAVDDMQMTIGKRTIKGLIKHRKEARRIYERARQQGQRASLLEQERPNIFTQSVANIMPGDNIMITIRYVNILRYAEGNYELVFPMVVGPRYISGDTAIGQSGTGWAPDTNIVPDASRITPPVLKPGERSGHDIALSVKLNAGVPIQNMQYTSHVVEVQKINQHERHIQLHHADRIPNKDFVLRYQVAGKAPEMATIAHHDERGGFFTLIIQPQQTITDDEVFPRELIFIVDTSGSMRGFPIEKSKEAIRRLLKGMRSTDIFNVVRFAGDTGTLWKKPRPYTPTHVDEAMQYINNFRGRGGTEMRRGILKALAQPANEGYLRIAFLLTDGYVGNEFGIFQSIEKERRGARVFSLGVGSSVNRYLLDRAAEIGRGESFYVRQDENSDEVIDKFFKRVDRPALAHIEIDWGNLDVTELYPSKIPDLWAGQPIRIHGRYNVGGVDTITVRGQLKNRSFSQKLRVTLPQNEPANEAMATVWARQQVHGLTNQMVRKGQTKELIEKVTQLGLTFRLMTKWTSFVAVEEIIANVDGKLQTIVQPVEMPEGVSYEGVFGEQSAPVAKGLSSGMVHFSAPIKKNNGRQRGFSPPRAANRSIPQYKGSGAIMGGVPGRTLSTKPRLKPPLLSAPPMPTLQTETSPPEMSKEEAEPRKDSDDSKSKDKLGKTSKNRLTDGITFEPGKTLLTEQVKRILDKLAAEICRDINNIKVIQITGHADNSTLDNFKQALSLKRAAVVADYLINQCSVLTYGKFDLKGEADHNPIASNSTEVGRAKNRRVEIQIK
ncbi:VIT domain-containing protein [Candidatus Parabeggiatoa sp. HSG14]|uniref:VIT domain-containing protein n=1 Tax=Candidatus Parabeggiatoa sp. HSG14 TaxID=3055593 RepID=UPI0025A7B2C4|nr:VIT domain-containing protein [Thiotrichales bacterium HSG14]